MRPCHSIRMQHPTGPLGCPQRCSTSHRRATIRETQNQSSRPASQDKWADRTEFLHNPVVIHHSPAPFTAPSYRGCMRRPEYIDQAFGKHQYQHLKTAATLSISTNSKVDHSHHCQSFPGLWSCHHQFQLIEETTSALAAFVWYIQAKSRHHSLITVLSLYLTET